MTARERMLEIARAEGIELTPAGEPTFARDLAHWEEIKGRDLCTAEERAVNALIEAAS